MTSASEIRAAAQALRAGELVAFPTETVYGLGADAANDAAVALVYATKGRPDFNPLIAHVADQAQAFALGEFPAEALALAARLWPGPLTVVVKRRAGCPVSLLATAGMESLALRVPGHPVALALLRDFGGAVVAPSANASGGLSPTTAEHVRRGLGSKVRVILDGGPCPVGVESTVVSFINGRPEQLRAGGIARAEIEALLGRPLAAPSAAEHPHSPGQLESHYAPRARLRLFAESPRTGEAYLGFGTHDHGPHNLSRAGNAVEAAANLFGMLHALDAQGVEVIAVAPVPECGLGEAINDRLKRAAAPRPAR